MTVGESIRHTVRQGQCVSSIAEEYGHFWQTLWEHPDNAGLRQRRGDPNVLYAGDVVVVPPVRTALVDAASERRHRFQRKGMPAIFRLRLLSGGVPRANLRYTLAIDELTHEGITNADGRLEVRIRPGARSGALFLHTELGTERYPILLGEIDPPDTPSGAAQRLLDLGYEGAHQNEPCPDDIAGALRKFQGDMGLPLSGELDAPTAERLKAAFGA